MHYVIMILPGLVVAIYFLAHTQRHAETIQNYLRFKVLYQNVEINSLKWTKPSESNIKIL